MPPSRKGEGVQRSAFAGATTNPNPLRSLPDLRGMLCPDRGGFSARSRGPEVIAAVYPGLCAAKRKTPMHKRRCAFLT
jgi:hypothetical protein